MIQVGIIGFGSFGELIAQSFAEKASVKVFSRTMSKVPEHLRASLEDVCRCDYLVLSVPLNSYRPVLSNMAKVIDARAVVIDVCSVKVLPAKLISELLPRNRLVATHPLFGPQTITEGLAGHVMALCDDVSDKQQTALVSNFCEALGLKIVHLSAKEHDQQMAKVHALTFFIARALFNTDFTDVQLKTPSFERLMSLVDLEHHHTQDLFDTIENGNPFAGEVRRQFLADASRLSQQLDAKGRV